MPGTNTGIDRELANTIVALRKVEMTVNTHDQLIVGHRGQTDLQIKLIVELLIRCEDQLRKIEATQEQFRNQLTDLERCLTRLKADHENLKKRAEEDRRRRFQLWVAVIVALIAFVLNLLKDIVFKPSG